MAQRTSPVSLHLRKKASKVLFRRSRVLQSPHSWISLAQPALPEGPRDGVSDREASLWEAEGLGQSREASRGEAEGQVPAVGS